MALQYKQKSNDFTYTLPVKGLDSNLFIRLNGVWLNFKQEIVLIRLTIFLMQYIIQHDISYYKWLRNYYEYYKVLKMEKTLDWCPEEMEEMVVHFLKVGD